MNYRLTLQYDGTEFHGWQVQAVGRRTVQGELERALSVLEGGVTVAVHGAGRTDAGVHAEGQAANAHLSRAWLPEKLRDAINGNLPRDLRVIEVDQVPDDFHARFSARGKTYCYRIFQARYQSPFCARYTLHEARTLDVEQMRSCAQLFIGTHDWTAFSHAQAEVESRVRTITRFEVKECWDERGRGQLIELTATADGFLRYMVRSLAGTLLEAGRSVLDEERIVRALDTGDRRLAGATAPGHGLSLVRVYYE